MQKLAQRFACKNAKGQIKQIRLSSEDIDCLHDELHAEYCFSKEIEQVMNRLTGLGSKCPRKHCSMQILIYEQIDEADESPMASTQC